MPLYTTAELQAEIAALKAKITKAEEAQSYDAGINLRLARGDLAAMYRRLERLEGLYGQTEGREAAQTGGIANKVRFERPV